MGEKPVIWCYTPELDPMPLLRTIVRYVTKTTDATAYVLSAHRVGSASHAFLEKFPVSRTYPRGSSLFVLPVNQQNGTTFLPAPPTDIAYNVYKISHDPTAAITAKLCKMSMNQTQYIFSVRIGRIGVKASSTYTSHILTEQELLDLEKDFVGTRHKLALGDTGATHSLITSQTARQIKAHIDISERGHVILGDNVSKINLLGTCEFALRVGRHVSTMKAYVIDADWGTAQHIVIGSDWISANRAMLGERDGKGPQLTVGAYTVYAKTKEHAPFLANAETHAVKNMNAMQFADFLDSSDEGRAWTAVDITQEGVKHVGHDRIPLHVYLSQYQFEQYQFILATNGHTPHLNNMDVVNGVPPQTHVEPTPKKPPKIPTFDPKNHTLAGVTLVSLEQLKTDFPNVFTEDLPDRADGSEPTVHSETIHTINLLPNAKPSFRKAWRTSPAERAEIDKQVKYMLAKGLIKPSSSPWGAPTLFAPKSDGSLCMCIDYRGLNAMTERDVYPLPRVDDVFAAIKHKKSVQHT